MKAIIAFTMFFLVNTILSGIMEGTGGIAATRLTAAITNASTTLNVANANGFLGSHYVVIGDEYIRYTSRSGTTFTVPAVNGRGYDGTEARAHAVGSQVYSPNAGAFNGVIGFNVATTGAAVGQINLFTALWTFATVTVPKLITWNFAHLQVTPWLSYLRYVFMAISAGFTVWVVLTYASAFGGVMQSIFRR